VRLVIGVAALFLASLPSAFAQSVKISIFENWRTHQWCALRDPDDFRHELNDNFITTIGALHFTSGKLTRVDLTVTAGEDPAEVDDQYSVSPDGALQRMVRSVQSNYGEVAIREVYVFGGGKARRISRVVTDSVTGEPKKMPAMAWYPSVPVRTTLKAFPFHGLLDNPALAAKAKVCVSGR